jgi:hypothetical protein
MRKSIPLTIGAAILLASAAATSAASFSTNFDNYSVGNINGQDGWVNDNTGIGAVNPDIIADPTGGNHGRVLRVNYTAADSDWSGAFRATGDLIAEGAQRFTLSWDQWRPALDDNVWISESITDPTWWGVEWDTSQKLHMDGFNDPSGVLAVNQWQNIRLVFDAQAQTIQGFVNGASFGTASGVSLSSFRGIDFEFSGTEAGGGVHGPLYLDNVSLQTAAVPEPTSLLALAGLLPGLALLRSKRQV